MLTFQNHGIAVWPLGYRLLGELGAIDNMSTIELQRARSLNHDLISHSQPVMEYLLDQVANTQVMMILVRLIW